MHDPILAKKLPERPAVVYACYDQDDEIIYIGATVDLTRRRHELAYRMPWWDEVVRIDSFPFARLADARAREAVAISTVRPRYNVQHKHDTDGSTWLRSPKHDHVPLTA